MGPNKDSDILLLNFTDILQRINGNENHLLIGNGFNYGLGIWTSYKSIFERMSENNKGIYKEAIQLIKDCKYDLEVFIGQLEDDINKNNSFLKKYVGNKVKFDFMKATHEIVKEGIKNVYAENNEGIYILLKNFKTFFSLNYDSSLYLLLMKYKEIGEPVLDSFALEPSLFFIEEDLNLKQSSIYSDIKNARDNGKWTITLNEQDVEKPLSKLTKNHFVKEISEYAKVNNKGWKIKDIEKVIEKILDEEVRQNRTIHVDDGSRQTSLFGNSTDYIFDVESKTQNLFFLHGAFHIYNERNYIKKITQTTDKALYNRLEDILNTDEKDIVCVFQCDNKKDEIEKNKYLRRCLFKLKHLSGDLIIIGSALSENDSHIFKNINNSNLKTIYISVLEEDKEKMSKIAHEIFSNKEVILFDAESISYK